MPGFGMNLNSSLRLSLSLRLELTLPQQEVFDHAEAAKKRLEIPYTEVRKSNTISVYKERLAARMNDVGSTLLGIPISEEMFTRPNFMELIRIFLTLQAAWRESNDKGIELLKLGFKHYLEQGNIKSLKYGGTKETLAQQKMAKALIEERMPDCAEAYLAAWKSDIEMPSFWTTDTLYDWLSMGKVCGGSCQSFDGSPYWNKSLGGPVFALDKLAFVGENKTKRCRTLLVPTGVKVNGRLGWDVVVPSVYTAAASQNDIAKIIEGALYAAGIYGCRHVIFLDDCFARFLGIDLEKIYEEIKDRHIVVEIKNNAGEVVRREKIIPREVTDKDCLVYAMKGPNRYKYWDNSGGIIDFKDARKSRINGVEVSVKKLSARGKVIKFDREVASD